MYYLESSCCCLAVVPQVPTRRDKRKCSDGQMEENRVKYAFFLICLFLYLLRGQDRKRKPFSPAGLVMVTQLQIIVASLVVSH